MISHLKSLPLAKMLLLPLLICVGCVGYEEELEIEHTEVGIIGGVEFGGLPAVGLMTHNGSPLCTGTLIEKRKVLTAAHCTGKSGNMEFLIGPSMDRPAERIPIVREVRHPYWEKGGDGRYDIAYVVLGRDASVEPMEVFTGHMDSSWEGRLLQFVGYGANDYERIIVPIAEGAGIKRSVHLPLDLVQTFVFRAALDGKAVCHGDSGGPVFWQDPATQKPRIVGISTSGECSHTSVGVQTAPFLPFLQNTEPRAQTLAKVFVRGLYTQVLRRSPDPGGFAYWSSGQFSAKAMVMGFFSSAEFTRHSPSDNNFLGQAYWAILDRGPDAGGLQYWMNNLAQGVSRQSVLESFVHSTEFSSHARVFELRID